MSKGTVLYVGALKLPDGNAGANHAWVVGKLLRDIGYDMAFMGADRNFYASVPVLETKRVVEGFTCFTSPRRNFLFSIDAITTIIEALGKQSVAAIIAVNYPAFPLYTLYRYCRKNGIALIAECTEWYPANEGDIAYRTLKWLDTQLRMTYVCKKIHNVICISRFLQEHFDNLGCHTLYLPSIVDKQDPKWALEPHTYEGNVRRFVYAGIPGKKDALHTILIALHEILQTGCAFEFQILGITKEEFLADRPNYKERLDDLNTRVIFNGRIPHRQVIQYIKGADFTIFIREKTRVSQAGFPTKFAESITCGIPPITNRTSNIADYLVNGENGLLMDSSDPKELKEVLLTAINMDQQQLDKMKERCRQDEQLNYTGYLAAGSQFMSQLTNDAAPPDRAG